jgi:hypothetical protein
MASTSISTSFVKQYDSTLHMLLELKGNMFTGKCIEESINGEEKYYDQLGSIYASEVTQQFADSPESDITHARRRVVATPYDVGIGLDKFDKVQELINPESGYVQRQVSALQRKSAIEFMNGALGTASTGKAGATPVVLPSGQYIAVGTGPSGAAASTGMNLEKLQATLQLFEENNLMLDDPMNKLYFAWGPQQKKELLETTQVTSSDYNTVKTLVNGQINSFYGFEFVTSNMIPYITSGTVDLTWGATDTPAVDANGVRACFAWAKSGVVQVTNPNLSTDVSQRKDKSNNWYSYSCLRTGAVRMEEEKVVIVPCDQSPGAS